jgi:hypothetical protein
MFVPSLFMHFCDTKTIKCTSAHSSAHSSYKPSAVPSGFLVAAQKPSRPVANATPALSRFPSAHRRHKDRTKPAFLSRIRPNVIQDKEGRQQASQPVNPLKGRPKANNCATRRVQSDTPDQHDPGLNQSNLVMRHPSPGFFAKHDVGRGRGIASSFTAWM